MKSRDVLPAKVERKACVRCQTLLPATLLRRLNDASESLVCRNEVACRKRKRDVAAKLAATPKADA